MSQSSANICFAQLIVQQASNMPITVPSDITVVHQQASSLIRAGTEVFLVGDVDDAQVFFDTSHALIMKISSGRQPAMPMGMRLEKMAVPHMPASSIGDSTSTASFEAPAAPQTPSPSSSHTWTQESYPDIYNCDVPPRPLMSPVTPTTFNGPCLFSSLPLIVGTDVESLLLEMTIIFNKGLIFQTKDQIAEAQQMYEFVAQASQWMFPRLAVGTNDQVAVTVATLAMRSCNNMGALHFSSNASTMDQAECYLIIASRFAQQLASHASDYALEYATTLSNLCRVQWSTSNGSIIPNLETVLSIRKTALGKEHPDTAASMFNLAVALYDRREWRRALIHLQEYLAIASQDSTNNRTGKNTLEIVPALTLLLLIQNNDNESPLSRELVRGLRTLQEKTNDGSCTPPEIASVLNFVGTMLFHQEDFENALVFFLEELRLEDKAAAGNACVSSDQSPSVVSVTCNNIGRITQELGRFDDAVYFYKRSLEDWYGAEMDLSSLNVTQTIEQTKRKFADCNNQSAIVNLYSTVWYNLGLILDKLRSYDEAMASFEMALALRQAMVGPNHPDIACLLYNIGVLQMENKRLADASVSLSKAITIRQIGVPGQLSDLYLIKTLEKLSKLHQKAGNVRSALNAYKQMLLLQEKTVELDPHTKTESIGIATASIAELHLTMNELQDAKAFASLSAEKLQLVFQQHTTEQQFGNRMEKLHAKTTKVEQLVSSLLLLGSVYHELCEPLEARAAVRQAKSIAHVFKDEWGTEPGRPSSLNAICEVTTLLSQSCAAPQA